MRALTILVPAFCLALAACGDDGGGGGGDDTAEPDAEETASVTMVSCTGITPDAEVTTDGSAYSPMSVTISAGEVVRFDPQATHDVNGEEFDVPLGGEGCFRFDTAGTYAFRCTPHGFTGSVVVQ